MEYGVNSLLKRCLAGGAGGYVMGERQLVKIRYGKGWSYRVGADIVEPPPTFVLQTWRKPSQDKKTARKEVRERNNMVAMVWEENRYNEKYRSGKRKLLL